MNVPAPPEPQAQSRPPGSFPRARTLFRVRGVPVRFDASWLLIAGAVTYFASGNLAAALDGYSQLAIVGFGVLAMLLFTLSILVHELGHAVASQERGIPVLAITLFGLGGVTESVRESPRARDELLIVGAGPFMSLVCAAAFGIGQFAVGGAPPLGPLFGLLAFVNVVLVVFNLMPGYPLDGGRLLRAVLWGLTRRPHASTRWAARIGQAFALLPIGFGAWVLWQTTQGASMRNFGGIIEILVGVMLFRGATEAHRRAQIREHLAGRTAGEAMGDVPQALDPAMTLDAAVEVLQARPSILWPVGVPAQGGVMLADVDHVPASSWSTTTLADLVHPEVTVGPDVPLDDVLDSMRGAPGNMLIVVDTEGRPLGLLTPSLVLPMVG